MLEDRPWMRRFEENRPLLSALLDKAPAAMLVQDSDGHIVLFNREFARLTGYAADEVMGLGITDILTQALREGESCESLDDLHSSELAEMHGSDWITSGSQVRRIRLKLAALHDDAGEIDYRVTTAVEVEEMSCECYEVVKRETDRLLHPSSDMIHHPAARLGREAHRFRPPVVPRLM